MRPKVTVFSDYICPFCFIGKQRVDRLSKEYDIEVDWKGIEIHPETPEGGATLQDLNFSESYIEMAMNSVKQLARDADLDIDVPSIIANSKAALEIAEYAKEKGKFDEYHDGIFKAY